MNVPLVLFLVLLQIALFFVGYLVGALLSIKEFRNNKNAEFFDTDTRDEFDNVQALKFKKTYEREN